ncbi:MAG TPA: Ig-like domain-containing protein [Methanomassiliicoccales archaeon]|jgi:hypothetical protein
MKGTKPLVVLLVILVAAIMVTSPILARNGGVGNADQQIGCAGTSKHSTSTAATVTMEGSPMNPQAGQLVTVWVNVTGGTVGRFVGVILSSSLATTAGSPSVDGWTNINDPLGTAFNYNERVITTTVNSFIWTLNAPASGTHVLYAKAFYPGPSSTTFTQGLSFTIGTGTPPSVVINAPAASSTQSGIAMSVSATVTPGSATPSISLTIDGVAVGSPQTVSTPSWMVDTTLYTNASHTLIVTATSTAGTGQASVPVTFANPGPTVVIDGPATGSTVSGITPVALTVTPLASSAIGSVTLTLDSGSPITVPAPYNSYQLDTTGLTNGAHTMVVRATDNLGRIGIAVTSFTVVNQGPSVSIAQPTDGSTISGNVTVNSTVALGPTSSPITQVVFSVDGASVQTKTATPYNFTFDTNAFANGVHSLTIRATDANLNNGSHTISVRIANGVVITTPPSVIISYPINGQVLAGTISVNTTVTPGTNAVNFVTMSVDGTIVANKSAGPFNFNLDTSSYVNGSNVINVTAYDTMDLLGFQTVSATFGNATVTAPTMGPLDIVTQTGTTQVTVPITGPVSYVTLSVDGSVIDNITIAPYSFTVDTTRLSNGQHSVNVTAVNAGGSSYKEATITVSNGVPQPTTDLSRWEATIIGGSLLLIGGVAFLVASVLMLRRSKMRRMR